VVLARLICFIPPESNQHFRSAELEHTFDTVSVSEMQTNRPSETGDRGFPASFAHGDPAFMAEKYLG
jgi:hypothetical protein